MTCGKCGKTINDDSVFCPYCGTKLQKLCESCGAELVPDAAFCARCGAAVSEEEKWEAAEAKDDGANEMKYDADDFTKRAEGNYSGLDRNEAGFDLIRFGEKNSCKIRDEIDSEDMNTPRRRQEMLEKCIPLYNAGELGEINAFTFERWSDINEPTIDDFSQLSHTHTGGLYYAAGHAIYGPDRKKFCDCGDVVSLLWAYDKLFITEIVEFSDAGRELKEEWSFDENEDDKHYIEDTYDLKLGLRVLYIPTGEELLKADGIDAVVSVFNPHSNDLCPDNCFFVDVSGNKWFFDRSNPFDPASVSKVEQIGELFKQYDIERYCFHVGLFFSNVMWYKQEDKHIADAPPLIMPVITVYSGSGSDFRKLTFKCGEPFLEPEEAERWKPSEYKLDNGDWFINAAAADFEDETDSKSDDKPEPPPEKKEPEKKFDKTTPARSNNSLWDKKCAGSRYPDLKTERAGQLSSGKVSDQWDISWQKKSPDGKAITRQNCSPLYSRVDWGTHKPLDGINVYTFERWTGFNGKIYAGDIYYAKDNVIYGPGGEKLCDCKDIVNLLWAGNMLFITEVSEFTYQGRHSYEWQQGDYGYTSDDYELKLGLRIIDVPTGTEILKRTGIDSIISARAEYNTNGQKWSIMDVNQVVWLLDRTVSPCTVTRIGSLEERLGSLNIPMSKLDKYKDKIVMHYPSAVFVYNEESKNVEEIKLADL